MTDPQGPAPRATWYDASYEAAYTATADRLVHRGAVESAAMVVDSWEEPDRPGEVLLVVSVRRGISLATARPFIPDWQALAWETDEQSDPRARLLEALLQGHLRAQERMTGGTGLAPLPR